MLKSLKAIDNWNLWPAGDILFGKHCSKGFFLYTCTSCHSWRLWLVLLRLSESKMTLSLKTFACTPNTPALLANWNTTVAFRINVVMINFRCFSSCAKFCNNNDSYIAGVRISMFPSTSSRETLRFSGNKIHCSPRDQSLSVNSYGWPISNSKLAVFINMFYHICWICQSLEANPAFTFLGCFCFFLFQKD